MNNRIRFILSVIFALAILIRIIAVFLVTGWEGTHSTDEHNYSAISRSLIEGNEIQGENLGTFHQRPLYMFFLAAIYKVFGYQRWPVQLIQVFISSISCIICYFIGLRFSKKIGLLSAFITAVHPYLSLLTAYLLTETLFILFFLLAILWFIKVIDQPTFRNCLGSSIWFVLAILTRPQISLSLFLILFWVWLNIKNKMASLRVTILVSFLVAILLAPWAYSNYKFCGKFTVPFPGVLLWAGNNPEAFRKAELRGKMHIPDSIKIAADLPESEKDKQYTELAFAFIKENPEKFMILLYYKFLRFWQWGYSTTIRNTIVTYLYGLLFFPFMLAGFFFSFKYSRKIWILHFMILYFTILSLIFFGADNSSGTRYRVPLEPLLSIFAAFGLLGWLNRYLPKSSISRLFDKIYINK
jgi:4-amino-4-deoxy-L-arabinose transferase-like glycosyltransferase